MHKFKNLNIIAITALVTFIVTGTVKDIIYLNNYSRVINKITSVINILNENCYYDIDEEKLTDYAASAIAESVGDIYTSYFPKTDFTSFNYSILNSYCGIGIVLTVDSEKNQLLISSVIDDSPAERAGILKGDYIVAVNGVHYDGDNMNEAVSVMRGDDLNTKINTEVTLSILRNNIIEEYTLIREGVLNDSVNEKMLSDDIGYIRIISFNSDNPDEENSFDTYDEFVESLSILKEKGMKKLVIDLRSNPGGYFHVVTKIADLLLPEGVMVYTLSKNNERIDYTSDENEIGIPMVVLVNEDSASASEILTGALRDYNRAVIIGEKTFGKGVVQKIFEFNDGSGVTVTESKYYTPSGSCIDGIGIEPDIAIPFDESVNINSLEYDEDIQLKRAVECLKAY